MNKGDLTMLDLSRSELLLYGGIAIMVVAVISAIVCIGIFNYTGRKLKQKIEQEYGKIQ